MDNRSKTVWGIVFILFIISAVFTISYQIISAPVQALSFVAKTGQSVYETDLEFRQSLETIDRIQKTSTVDKNELNLLSSRIAEIKKTVDNIQNQISSLSQIEKWALDSYDYILSKRMEILSKAISEIEIQIRFTISNIDTINNYHLLIDSYINNNQVLECNNVLDTINKFNVFLPNLKKETVEKIINLSYQKNVYDYIDSWNDKNTILLSQITSEDCTINDSDFLSKDYLFYSYYPETRLYVTGSYITNLENVTDKIEALIDKL